MENLFDKLGICWFSRGEIGSDYSGGEFSFEFSGDVVGAEFGGIKRNSRDLKL